MPDPVLLGANPDARILIVFLFPVIGLGVCMEWDLVNAMCSSSLDGWCEYVALSQAGTQFLVATSSPWMELIFGWSQHTKLA